jgi:hypothetical protein
MRRRRTPILAAAPALGATPAAALGATLALGLALAATAAVLWATPAAAQARASDAAPTRTYVQADYALGRSAKAHLRLAEAAIRSFTDQVRGECPGVVATGPQNPEAELLYEEVVAAVTRIVYRSDAAAIARFAHTVAGLRWSSPRVTRTVHAYAARLSALSALAMPNVCADAKAWAQSGYKTLPESTTVDVQRLKASERGPSEVPPGLLAPYEHRALSRLAIQTRYLEAQLQEAEATTGAGYLGKIVGTIGLHP